MWLIIFPLCIILLSIASLTVCHYATKNRKYWLYRKVPYREPCPIFGNFGAALTTRISYTQMLQYFYDKYRNERFVGIFQARRPSLLITDLYIIKQTFTQHFSCFSDRAAVLTDTRREPLLRNIFNMSGSEWKAMRQIVSPTFSSAKMKAMFPLIADCAQQLRETLEAQASNETDVPELTTRYMTDVIGSCAFGLNPGSLKDPSSPFLIMEQKMFKVDVSTLLKRYCRTFFPRLFKFCNFRSYPTDVEKFFTSLISQVLSERRRTGEKRDDFLQLMMSQQNSDLIITDELITSNSFVFMLAGLQSSSTTLSFCLYELSKRKELQDELRKEIIQCCERHGGLNYEAVSSMKLVIRTLLETLRLHSPTPIITRLCTQPCRLPATEVDLQQKDALVFPIHAIQNDPQYFPDPEKFDPERFADNLNPPGLLAFGDGPRGCPGARFAQLAMSAALSGIIGSHEVEPCGRTTPQIVYDPRSVVIKNKGGIWLRFKKINDNTA